jgi:hypothetical protein
LDYEVENQSVTADACRDLEHECVSSFRNTNKNKYQSVLHVMFLKKKIVCCEPYIDYKVENRIMPDADSHHESLLGQADGLRLVLNHGGGTGLVWFFIWFCLVWFGLVWVGKVNWWVGLHVQ